MAPPKDEQVRSAVRGAYAAAASAQEMAAGRQTDPQPCCGGVQISDKAPSGDSCCGWSPGGLETAAPGTVTSGLACGNPTAVASLKPGETVVDLGSGGGFDCFLAAEKVGPAGTVIGVDMTPEMVGKARENAQKAGAANVEFRLGEIEHLPVADGTADIIISNCVINLAPDKLSVYKEAFRVLKPGGRLTIADTMAKKPLPEEIKKDLGLWSCCIGGAITPGETEHLLRAAGFERIKITENQDSRDLVDGWTAAAGKRDLQIVSATIEAFKPARR